MFDWVVCFIFYWSCISFLYILEINPLLVATFENIFSLTIRCLFDLLIVSFAVQKLLSLIRSHLFIFAFISFALRDSSKKKIATIYVRMFFLCSLLEFHGVVLFLGLQAI